MRTSCPAGTVDERAVRGVAGIVVLLAALSLWEPANLLTALLAADFAIRGFGDRRYSPFRWIAKRVVATSGLAPRPIFAPPKRFAARIGTVITVAALLLHLTGNHEAALIVTGALIAAASLEAFLGVCVACWIYPVVYRGRATAR